MLPSIKEGSLSTIDWSENPGAGHDHQSQEDIHPADISTGGLAACFSQAVLKWMRCFHAGDLLSGDNEIEYRPVCAGGSSLVPINVIA
jgi:hypothetical protein